MTASDFTNLHLQYKSAQADGEVPAVIEHDFPGGRMVDHYFVTPSPAFWADEGVQSLDGVSGTKTHVVLKSVKTGITVVPN